MEANEHRDVQAIDALVLAKLAASHERVGPRALGTELELEPDEIRASLRRLEAARVWSKNGVEWMTALDFFEHALKFLVPPRTKTTRLRGIPTCSYVPPLDSMFASTGAPWVWPDEDGEMIGRPLEPIDPLVVDLIEEVGEDFHVILACADCFRVGGARERETARLLLSALLKRNANLQRRRSA